MTINHIDQLEQWYADAEQITKTNLPNKGDTLIYPRYGGDGYSIETNPDEWTPSIVGNHETVRILARTPKPKPAWRDAVAVMARCSNAPEGHREPFIRSEATPDVWIGEGGYGRTEDLRDVTPLIEAKVTGAMTVAAISAYRGIDRSALSEFTRDEVEDMRRALAAALGLETE